MSLQGAELETFLKRERAIKEKEAVQQAALARTQRMLEADEEDTDSETTEDEDLVEEPSDLDILKEGKLLAAFAEPGTGSRRRRDWDMVDFRDWANNLESGAKSLVSFDIYLKGNVSKSNPFFKSSDYQTTKFRMFPLAERRRRVDAFGEAVDAGVWLRKGKFWEEAVMDKENRELKRMIHIRETMVCTA